MKIKKYIADSVPEAMQRIRSELGREAVILNSKPIRTGGWLGLFSKKRFEVTAAVDDHVARQAERGLQDGAGSSFQQVLKSQFPHAEEAGSLTPQLMRELKEMKQSIQMLAAARQGEPAPRHPLAQYLLRQEVDPQLIEEWTPRFPEYQGVAQEDFWSKAKSVLAQEIEQWVAPRLGRPISKETRMVHFIGPTGVGKTTTIAKIAAEYVLHKKQKVGLITADTYRISAVEQLRTYANILDVPMEVVFSPQEMERAIEKLSGTDLILMDTAGRNYHNPMHVSELKSFFQHSLQHETFLVLSATMKSEDLLSIVDVFATMPNQQVIMTKLDETRTYGNLLNLLYRTEVKLAYLTDGQNVPDDIMQASPQQISAWLTEGITAGERERE